MREVGRAIAAEAQISVGNLKRQDFSGPSLGTPSDPLAVAPGQTHPSSQTVLATLYDEFCKSSADAASRKIFIRNIAEEVSDSVIESLLLETGEINYWKRTKIDAGKPVSFGSAEFSSIEGLLRAIRLMPRLVIFDKKLEVNYSDKTKNMISDFVQYRKAVIAADHPGMSNDDVDQELTRLLIMNDATIEKKLWLIIQKFQEHRGRIVKASVTEKNSIVAATEEKLGLFKQKFDLMNEKELNEAYSKEVELWLKEEAEWEEKLNREKEALKNAHKRKSALIEAELKVKDEDLLPKNEKQEIAFRKARERRAQILREDEEAERPKVSIAVNDFERNRKANGKENAEEARDPRRKKIKTEVLNLEPTVRPSQVPDARDHPRQIDADAPRKNPEITLNLSLPIELGSQSTAHKKHESDILVKRPELGEVEETEEVPLVFEGRGAGTADTLNRLSKKVNEGEEKFENLEKMLMKWFKKGQSPGKQAADGAARQRAPVRPSVCLAGPHPEALGGPVRSPD